MPTPLLDAEPSDAIAHALRRARAAASIGEDDAAKRHYLDLLRLDPTHARALNEMGALADASGHRSAARTAYAQAARCHPADPAGHVNLANLLLEDDDLAAARQHYQAALDADPACALAHQGMARIVSETDEAAADEHWRRGFAGHAIVTRRYRGNGPGVPMLLLVSARGGNIPTRHLIDDRVFAITAMYAEFLDPMSKPPPHGLVVNAIGDADLCGLALARAEALLAGGTAPVINRPARVRATGRADNARRLAAIPGVIAPAITMLPRGDMHAHDDVRFPLLLRAPGFHTGRHFTRVSDRAALAGALAALPGDHVLAIDYLDARGPDGLARKYRAMYIDGVLYPLHLAISSDWKVHYFSAAMAAHAAHRAEEQNFLDDMPRVLGARAVTALAAIGATLGLDYAGIDFALGPDGAVLLFEANATMVINPPDPHPMWEYRRPAIAAALAAARRMFWRRVTVRHGSRT